ncbi:HU family DNA-binding protein [bacterium]|nr:HU family DNA-binding protein [bacterium]
MTITKDDIAQRVAEDVTKNQKLAKTLIEATLKNIKECLSSGNELQITGFGIFKIRHKAARIGRNPKTKVEHVISERKIVVFHPSRIFRQEVDV